MVKICQTCGTQAIDDQSKFCTKCGATLPPDRSQLKTSEVSFRYSKKFYGVIGLDLLISFLVALGGVGAYIDITNSGYRNPIFLILIPISLFNLILDGILLSNKREHPYLIDIRLCWLKCLFGFLGIFTIISGFYFAIISLNMNNAQRASATQNQNLMKINNEREIVIKMRDEEVQRLNMSKNPSEGSNFESERLQTTIKNSISELETSGNIQLITNFIKRYPDFNVTGQNFANLKVILAKKGYIWTDFELKAIIMEIRSQGEMQYIKKRVLDTHPKSSDECIKNFIKIFAPASKPLISVLGATQTNSRIRSHLIEILKNNFDYQEKNFSSDLIRIEKEIELEKFERSITGDQNSGKRITIDVIDGISGYEFERVLKELFEKMGYRVIHTTLSNDQGADLIVEKFDVKTVIQAKNWQNNVANSAVQEVVAAIKHYDAHRAMVISSSGFTQSARELAQSNNVVLWDRSILSSMLDENPIFRA